MQPATSLVKGFELTLNIQGIKFNCVIDSIQHEQAYLLIKNTDIPMGLIILAKDLNALINIKPTPSLEEVKPKRKSKHLRKNKASK